MTLPPTGLRAVRVSAESSCWNIFAEERFLGRVELQGHQLRSIGNRLSQDTWRRIKALIETDLGLRPSRPDARPDED